MPDAFGGHVVARGQVMQGQFLLAQPAAFHDVAAAVIQGLDGADQTTLFVLFPVALLQQFRRVGVCLLQVMNRGGEILFPIFRIIRGVKAMSWLLRRPSIS